jgi:hypothetical protein
VPPGGAAALQCLARNQAKLSAACGKAVAAVSGASTPTTVATTPTAGGATAPAAAMVLRPMRPREELMVLRSACGADVRSLCGGVAPGGGRIAQCLAGNAASLSPACRQVLSQFATRCVASRAASTGPLTRSAAPRRRLSGAPHRISAGDVEIT